MWDYYLTLNFKDIDLFFNHTIIHLSSPIINYVWIQSTNTKIPHLLTSLSSRPSRTKSYECSECPWYIRNEQLHCELTVSTIHENIKRTTKKCLISTRNNVQLEGFNTGRKGIHTRLKRQLLQDIYLNNSDRDSEQWGLIIIIKRRNKNAKIIIITILISREVMFSLW